MNLRSWPSDEDFSNVVDVLTKGKSMQNSSTYENHFDKPYTFDLGKDKRFWADIKLTFNASKCEKAAIFELGNFLFFLSFCVECNDV